MRKGDSMEVKKTRCARASSGGVPIALATKSGDSAEGTRRPIEKCCFSMTDSWVHRSYGRLGLGAWGVSCGKGKLLTLKYVISIFFFLNVC